MEGVKGDEQMRASKEVVVSIMGMEEPSRENIQCAGVDPVQFLTIASSSSSSSSQMLKSSSSFTPNIEGSSQPPRHTYSKMFKESGKSGHFTSLHESSPLVISPTSQTNSRSFTESVMPTLFTIGEVTKYLHGGEDDDDDDDDGDEANVESEREEVEMTITKKKQDNKTKFLGLLEFTVFMCVLVIFITSLTAHKLRHRKILNLYPWRWCSLGFVILCGRLMAEWFVNILVFSTEKKKTLFFVNGLRKSFQALIWSALVLLVWCLLITWGVKQPEETAKILEHITRGLISCLVGTTLWMMKTLLLKKVASSYLTTQYFDSIRQSVGDGYFISILSGPPLMESPHRLDNQNIGKSSVGKTFDGVIGRQTEGDFGPVVDEDHVPTTREIRNVLDAKWAASLIFSNVAKRGNRYIEKEDLMRFMNNEDVLALMGRFEGVADRGKIKESTLRNWMVNTYKDRQFLRHALDDTKANIEELNNLLSGVLVVLIIVIALLVMEIATTELMILISSQIAVLAFIFGNACKDAFECVMFVFVRRLYSVGDCCVIEGVQMTVEEVRITKTVFLKNEKEIIVYPNSILATKPLINFHRTPPTNYSVEFVINLSTPFEKIEALKAKVKAYIEREADHWRSKHSIQFKEIIESNKLKMALDVSHSVYFLDDEEKSSQRSRLISELKKIFEELDIK